MYVQAATKRPHFLIPSQRTVSGWFREIGSPKSRENRGGKRQILRTKSASRSHLALGTMSDLIELAHEIAGLRRKINIS